ncbi:MAG TPA: DUF695 domain-containing protein [Acidimicrobiia bacterium]|jgi:hypothetical protein
MFRRKVTVASASDAPAWQVYRGTSEDGGEIFARFNTALAKAVDRSDYPIQVGLAFRLNDPDERGLPTSGEMDELAVAEDLIVERAGERAILAGVVTAASMRELVLYTTSDEWIDGFRSDVERAVTTHRIDLMSQHDTDWTVYHAFVG